jgi:hypothetical protein
LLFAVRHQKRSGTELTFGMRPRLRISTKQIGEVLRWKLEARKQLASESIRLQLLFVQASGSTCRVEEVEPFVCEYSCNATRDGAVRLRWVDYPREQPRHVDTNDDAIGPSREAPVEVERRSVLIPVFRNAAVSVGGERHGQLPSSIVRVRCSA